MNIAQQARANHLRVFFYCAARGVVIKALVTGTKRSRLLLASADLLSRLLLVLLRNFWRPHVQQDVTDNACDE